MIETSWKWASLGLNQGPPDYESGKMIFVELLSQ